ncbi:MAG: hypothetical protein KKE16_03165 [Firmicutes bacterium]|nr:hypothetical protein [Bacillota bacterium]
MTEKAMKKRLIVGLAMLIFSLSVFAFATYAWFTYVTTDSFFGTVGFVDVESHVYFDDGLGGEDVATEVEIADGVFKTGVYFVNIVSNGDDYFFEDFRLSINVLSNVNTYIRIRIFEQVTLTYVNYLGIITELTVLIEDYLPFDYETTNWYDNRDEDGYFYYTIPVQRVDESTPLVLDLISDYTLSGFSTYSPGYSLQITFSLEAVQATNGPQNNWALTTPPWGGSW